MEMALRLGRLDVAKWLYQTFPDCRVLDPSCGYYDSRLALWGCKCEWTRVHLEIAQYVHTELDWSSSQVYLGYIKKMALAAAAEGNVGILQFLFEAFESVLKSMDEVPFDLWLDPDCFKVAATNGHLSVVRWSIPMSIYELAVQHLRLSVLQSIHLETKGHLPRLAILSRLSSRFISM